jgi:hypothetical protein
MLMMLVLIAGCATEPPQAEVAVEPVYDDAVAASLVYEPAVTLSSPRVEVAREGRANEAYAGFEDVISTFYWLRVDDRQVDYGANRTRSGARGWSGDRYERRAISTRVGVTHR